MKHSHRRQMIGNLAALLAAPLALGRVGLDVFGVAGEEAKSERGPAFEPNKSTIRPRIGAPKGSVVRRG